MKSIPKIPIDAVGIAERAQRFATRSIKKESKLSALELALRMIDLTTLEGADSPGKVRQLCHKGMTPAPAYPEIPSVAAICVYPTMIATAKDTLAGSNLEIASVATAFPSGQSPLKLRLDEVKYCVKEGATEIDMVISRGKFLAGDFKAIDHEIRAFKEACGNAHLKVILETGELGTLENIRYASDIAMHAGADFIKTSTGKINPASTPEFTLVMLQAIKDFYEETGKMVGMKPAGGIRDSKTAIHYLVMVKEILGEKWLTPKWFRFGASSLANDLLMQIVKQLTNRYQNPDYYTLD